MNILRLGNKSKAIICLAMCVIFLTGCPGFSDWEYTLPNGYEILKINSQDIEISKKSDKYDGVYTTILDRYILAFSFNERHIGLQRVEITTPYNEPIDIDEIKKETPEFYLIDSQTDTIYGPMTASEYAEQLITLDISNMCEWKSTLQRTQ